jgi:hypothetical protein
MNETDTAFWMLLGSLQVLCLGKAVRRHTSGVDNDVEEALWARLGAASEQNSEQCPSIPSTALFSSLSRTVLDVGKRDHS